MTPNDYQQFALSTYCAPEHVDRPGYLMHLLFEEVGEVMSLFAKSMRDGHDVDRDTLLHELGDVLWCVACLHWQTWRSSRPAKSAASSRAVGIIDNRHACAFLLLTLSE